MLEQPRLLIVDDDTLTLDALARVLKKDFLVSKASSPGDALKILTQHQFAVLLSDYSMPEMSGAEFLKRANEISPLTVRTVITGFSDLGVLTEDLAEQSIHRFLIKPWDNEILRYQMLECLQYHQVLVEKAHLENLSSTDPKTGLWNARYFAEKLQIEMDRARRHNRPLSLVLMDLDGFKRINDELGHPAGDRYVHLVADVLRKSTRTIDYVCRYGGDEFSLVLPDTSASNAYEVAERIRKDIEQVDFSGLKLSLSLGVCEIHSYIRDAQDFIETADRALYQAKNKGRNQTVIAPSTSPLLK